MSVWRLSQLRHVRHNSARRRIFLIGSRAQHPISRRIKNTGRVISWSRSSWDIDGDWNIVSTIYRGGRRLSQRVATNSITPICDFRTLARRRSCIRYFCSESRYARSFDFVPISRIRASCDKSNIDIRRILQSRWRKIARINPSRVKPRAFKELRECDKYRCDILYDFV